MEYTIQEVVSMTKVSSRTLRHYDAIGLLRPSRVADNGYRIYDSSSLSILQIILSYRELGIPLKKIKDLLSLKKSKHEILSEQKEQLQEEILYFENLIKMIDITLKEDGIMKDEAKFTAFKKQKITENNTKYSVELQEKYGENTIDASNKKLENASHQEYEEAEKLSEQILELLTECCTTDDTASEKAEQVYLLHKQWISFYWAEYNPKAHRAMGAMYMSDERFQAFYDAKSPGNTRILKEILEHFIAE